MDKQEAKERIKKLRKEINHHHYLYHVLDRPEISDQAHDSLKRELIELEKRFPEFITSDSPTQRVGGRPLDKFVKVKHRVMMLSLGDAFSKEEVHNWKERIKKLAPNEKFDFFGELKIDGFAVSLLYKKGVLSIGATRGDGIIGEDVTQNLKTIDSIPLRLRNSRKEIEEITGKRLDKEINEISELEIRGEVFMSKKAFELVNKERIKNNEEPYANPRNTAAGTIRQLDPAVARRRKLDFMAYDLVGDLGQKKHSEEHDILKELGFKTDKTAKELKDVSKVWDYFNEIGKIREKLSFMIDGLVISVNNNRLYEKLGVVGKTPRGALALKFPGKEATTIIKDIRVQVGRTGALTPIAVLNPVNIAGVTVSRATLHNEDEIRRLDVRIGDTVIVARAGDVIPDIMKVLKNLRPKKTQVFKMPTECPICGSRVIKKQGEVAHYCTNKKCSAIERKKIYHFVSKKAFNIEGLGPKIIDQLIDEKLINDAADIFSLKEGDLVPLERFAEKSASNLIGNINKSKNVSLARFIYSLAIRHVGEETARDISLYFDSIKKVKEAHVEDFMRIKDVGGTVARSLYKWFRDRKNNELLDKLQKSGVIINKPKKIDKRFQGKTFVLTGSLRKLTRDEAKEKIYLLGGEVSSSVSRNTDYVVVGEDPGSKYNKAKRLNVKMIYEKDFLKMLKNYV